MSAGAGQDAVRAPARLPRYQRKYGLIDEFCAHRGVSLWFGRNEENGLRCSYHGWKYDTTGQCIDVPSEPRESASAARSSFKSYPLVKRGPILWTYMGPPDRPPPLPEWEFATVAAEQTFISKRLQDSNWLQAMEGGIDSSHVSFLHRGDLGSDPLFKGAKGNEYNLSDMRPHFEVVEQPGGLFIGARRKRRERQLLLAHHALVMPTFTMIPPRADHPIHGHFWIPIDDVNCWAWTTTFIRCARSPGASSTPCRTASACIANTCPGPIGRSPTKDMTI